MLGTWLGVVGYGAETTNRTRERLIGDLLDLRSLWSAVRMTKA